MSHTGVSIDVEVSADRHRMVARLSDARWASVAAPAAPVVGAPALFVVGLAPGEGAGSGLRGAARIGRAESGILTLAHAGPLGPSGGRILARCPGLTLGTALEAVSLAPAPGALDAERAVWLPLVADVMELLDRAPLPLGAAFTCWGDGLTDDMCAGLVGRRGGVVLPRPVVSGSAAGGAARPQVCLLIGADARAIEAAVTLVADRGMVLLLDPRAPDCRFDFYRDVHRRGLSLIHAAPGCGVSRECLDFLLDEATPPRLPVLTLGLGAGERVEAALDLPQGCAAVLLKVEV